MKWCSEHKFFRAQIKLSVSSLNFDFTAILHPNFLNKLKQTSGVEI